MLSDEAVALLPSVEEFMLLVEADASILNDNRASKVKSILEKLGAKIPKSKKKSSPKQQSSPKAKAAEPEKAEPEKAESADEPEDEEEEVDPEIMSPETEDFPLMPESEGDDWENAGTFKEAANEAKSNGDFKGAVDAFSKALGCQSSALTFANRADCLLRLKRPMAAIADCDAALKINPDSAKALKIKGKALRYLGNWEESHVTLSKAMSIDFDPDLQEMHKYVEAKSKNIREKKAKDRMTEQEEIKKKKAEARERERRAAAERASQSAQSTGGMPGGMGGMPGGMPGMGGGMPAGMADIMNDPEIVAGLSNPKVMSVLQGMMGGDTSGMAAAMQDPEVGPILMKLQAKMGGMGGMPGGMGGMPGGMGGIPGGMPNNNDDDDLDDLPDLDEVPDLD